MVEQNGQFYHWVLVRQLLETQERLLTVRILSSLHSPIRKRGSPDVKWTWDGIRLAVPTVRLTDRVSSAIHGATGHVLRLDL